MTLKGGVSLAFTRHAVVLPEEEIPTLQGGVVSTGPPSPVVAVPQRDRHTGRGLSLQESPYPQSFSWSQSNM